MRGLQVGLAISIFLLGVFLIFQWALKDVTKKDDSIDQLTERVAALKSDQSKLASKEDIADLLSKFTVSIKVLEEGALQSIGRAHEKNKELHEKVATILKEIEFMKVHQHSTEKKLAEVKGELKKEMSINIHATVEPSKSVWPVSIIDTPRSREHDKKAADKQMGNGTKSLLQKSGISP